MGWSQEDLSKLINVSLPTLRNIEKGGDTKQETLKNITSAFEDSGIEFTIDDGVKRKSSAMKTLQGQQGYWDFYDDVYETTKKLGGEILVSNVDELLFTKWLGERGMVHKNRMNALSKEKPFSLKILIREGDSNFTVPEYAEYRWTPKDRFSEIPFYVYGRKLAIILFEEKNVSIYIIDNPKISEAYKKQFNVIWDQAIIIPKDRLITVSGTELDE